MRQSPRLESYGLLGDTETVALVGRDGSIDWMCMPHFESDACFAALLGTEQNGRWLLAPVGEVCTLERRYREGTLILETTLEVESGVVRLVETMPLRGVTPDIVRVVEGLEGEVTMRMVLEPRYGYGADLPWIRREDSMMSAIAGPNALSLLSRGAPLKVENASLCSEFRVPAGERVGFVLSWHASHLPPPEPIDLDNAILDTEQWWRRWFSRCTYDGPFRAEVLHSLMTLKALTFAPTGSIVAAPTTSLPEKIGGVRNWDYRYSWLRDATFTLLSLIGCGFKGEAEAWCNWLLRAVAGDPAQLQIMYGIFGERRFPELTLDWLPGYDGSKPVRIGNAAAGQFQMDVYGEVMDCLHHARRAGIELGDETWRLQRGMLAFLESHWEEPDNGIWEVRGKRRHFTHSKVMAWVAFDRAVKAVERLGLDGPVDRWRRLRDRIHREVCDKGFDRSRGTFTQYYGSRELDASLLLIPIVGFLRPEDPRVRSTVEAIRRELCFDHLVLRYSPSSAVDPLPEGEGAFLACSFWMADCLALLGEREQATRLFERLLSLRAELGFLSEEYDPREKRLLGNYPQALSHVALVNTARVLTEPLKDRAERAQE